MIFPEVMREIGDESYFNYFNYLITSTIFSQIPSLIENNLIELSAHSF